MQLNQTQPSPHTVLLQLNFCYQVQTTVVSPGAHLSSYNSVATTLYSTLVYCHLWPVGLYHIFPHYLINCTVLGGRGGWEVIQHKMCILIFSANFSETLPIIRRN
jgi:hypothetical protein